MASELTIVSGAHVGASFALTQEMLLIGADADCDVWLSDPGLASRHAALLADERGVAIRPLEGAVSVAGQIVKSATRCVLTPGCEITLGDSGVRLRLVGKAASDEPVKPSVAPRAQRKSVRSRAIMASMLTVAGILAVALAVQKLRPASAETPAQPAPTAKANDVELIEQLREVFRGSGYEIEATRLGPKRVRIDNLDAKNPRVRRATEQARADIPQLSEIVFASPDSTAPPAQPPFYEDEPAGHLTINVSGETAYLAAPNGVRYFAGSVLPSGYTVRRITASAIQVDRDGQISWLGL